MRLIDAERLKADVFTASMDEHFMPMKLLDCDTVTEMIDTAPTIEERKKGKWITEETGIRSYATKCSVCGTILHEGHNWDNAQEYTEYIKEFGRFDKFCHECGTKMEMSE